MMLTTASIEVGRTNECYASEKEFLYGLADALKEEYEGIAASGLLLQVDDAWLPALWDRIGMDMGIDAFRRRCALRIEALNHALRNVPEEQVRYHLCWGSWHGPHAHDLPLKDIVDILLRVKAQTYLIEGANVRHEHEYSVWDEVKLPAGKILAPGVVQDHVTIGGSVKAGGGEVNAFFAHGIKQTVRGQQSIPPLFGGGNANVHLEEDIFGVSYAWKF